MKSRLAEVLVIPKRKGEYGKGSIVQRGNHWQISFYDDQGRRRRESYSTEAKAAKALKQKLTLKEVGKLDEPEARTTIDGLADLYLADRKGTSPKSFSWLDSVWKIHLKPFFGGYIAARITTEKLVAYRNERLEAEASPTSVNKEMMIFRSMFLHGLNDYTPPKVTRVPKFPDRLDEPAPRKGFLTDEQYDQLQANCPYHWLRALLCLSYTYGFRRAELVGRPQRNQPPLRVEQLDMKNRTINLWPGETKSGEGRTIKMTNEVYDFLRVCVDGKKPNEAVFTWADGRPVKDFRGAWDKMAEAAGVSVLLHDFRRSAARNLIRSGVSRDVAKRITGHKTDSMFTRYNITDEGDLAEAAEKLEARRLGRKLVTEAQGAAQSSVKRLF